MMTAIALAAALLGAPAPLPSDALTKEIRALDAKVFDAYNRCDLPAFSSYFDPKVAFYHDTGGATFDRDAMVDGVRKNICGKVKRELIPPTFRVYPIKDYGAIEEGEHRFCELATGHCGGIAKFVMIWMKQGGAWRITNVLSYGHRAATPEEQRDPVGGH
jgi:hypothetical protein